MASMKTDSNLSRMQVPDARHRICFPLSKVLFASAMLFTLPAAHALPSTDLSASPLSARAVSGAQGVNQQTTRVQGVVRDASGEPLIGVSVREKGTENAAITDMDGRFNLTLHNASSVVTFSYVGFQSLSMKARANMQVVMREDQHTLGDVVVVGYGSQKKANLTGAVTSVEVDKALSGRPIADVGRGLQGMVPGMKDRKSTRLNS